MKRIIIKIFIQLSLFSFLVNAVSGQVDSRNFLTHKVLINQDGHKIEAYVKPTKGLPVEPDKEYFWFSGNKIKTTQGGYSKKLLHGMYREWYGNNNLKELGSFYKGLKTGIWKTWNENGKLIADYTWNFGKKNGIYHKYDSLGTTIEEGKYKNDILNGKQEILLGDSTKTIFYKKGKITQLRGIVPNFIRHFFSK